MALGAPATSEQRHRQRLRPNYKTKQNKKLFLRFCLMRFAFLFIILLFFVIFLFIFDFGYHELNSELALQMPRVVACAICWPVD